MKRSNAPVFWLLFGGGGMLSALLGTAMVWLTGLAAPLGLPPAADLLAYERMSALAQHWLGKGFLFVAISLFAWHAVHRIYHSLHDVGLPTGTAAKFACYGTALLITAVTAAALLALGW
ncbi:MAG TPA: fumarate reductase subunit FrdD [Albitalea sp.]